jgi:hypothetical protein
LQEAGDVISANGFVEVGEFLSQRGERARESIIRAMDTNEIIEAIDAEIQRLQAAKALLGGSPTRKPAAKPSPKSGRRKMSAAGRARIVAAQKARWAKVKASR